VINRDKEMISIRRRLDLIENRRFPDRSRFAGRAVDQGKLRGRVIIKEFLVEGISQQILIGPGGRDFPVIFLNVRPFRNRWGRRRRAAIGDYCMDQQ
jgi:hypothetical protein